MQPTDGGRQQHLPSPLSPRRPPLSLPPGPPSNFSSEYLHNNTKCVNKSLKFNTFNHYNMPNNQSFEELDADVDKYSKLFSVIRNSQGNSKSASKPSSKHLKKSETMDEKSVSQRYSNNEFPTIRANQKLATKKLGDSYDNQLHSNDVSTSSNYNKEYLHDSKYFKKNVSKCNTFDHYDFQNNTSSEMLDSEVLNKYSELFSALKNSNANKIENNPNLKPTNYDKVDDKRKNQYLCEIDINKQEPATTRGAAKIKNDKQNTSSEVSSLHKRDRQPVVEHTPKSFKKSTPKSNTFNDYDFRKNNSKEVLDSEVLDKYSKLFSAIKALNENNRTNKSTVTSETQYGNNFEAVEKKHNTSSLRTEESSIARKHNKDPTKNDKFDRTSDSQYTSNDAESIQSFDLDTIPVYNPKVTSQSSCGSQYVDMSRSRKNKKIRVDAINNGKDIADSKSQAMQVKLNDDFVSTKKSIRKGSYDLKVMPSFNESNHDTPSYHNKSHGHPHKQAKYKKCSSITSSTSEDNEASIPLPIKIKMDEKLKSEYRKKQIQSKFESATVDRRLSKKSANKKHKIKRRGSCNLDSSDDFADMTKMKNVSHSVKNCASKNSNFDDKKSLQISAEDMVQIANCGARNKNGSLCHFISTNNENYLSISQALLNDNTITRKKKHYSSDKHKKRSMASLPFESSDDTTTTDDAADFKQRRNIDRSAELLEGHRIQKTKSEAATVRKINDLGIPKTLNGYFVLKDEPVRLRQQDNQKNVTKRDKCLVQSDCSCRDGGEVNHGNAMFHAKEELRPLGDVNESFDF